ncbi:MAG: 30S ribosomal protein S11 [Kiritimatiellales bacterium]|nr:30S ribosomal protein S11 [Kiritimatiellales bacterium]
MAEETKPVEEVVEEAAVETPAAEAPVAETAVEAPAVEKKAEEAPVEEKAGKKPVRERDRDIFAVIEGDKEEEAKPKRKMKGAKNIPYGIAFIKTTFNNTIVSLTDMKGEVVSWSSAGRCGFKGSRKSTAFAATTVAQEAARGAISHGMNEVEVRVQGPGAGRESAVRAIQAAGLRVSAIKDTTPIPHNGCRPKKQRRV